VAAGLNGLLDVDAIGALQLAVRRCSVPTRRTSARNPLTTV